MSDEVSWQVELELKPGRLGPFRGLTEEMVDATRGEAGAVPCVISDRSDLLGERRPVRLEGFEERAWDGGSCRIRRSA